MRTVGAVIFPGFELLDLYGPLEFYGMLPEDFELRMVAETRDPVRSGQGPRSCVDDSFSDAAGYDVLLVPGGPGTRREVSNEALLGWLKDAAPHAELVTSVCTGAALLAQAGLLDEKQATTNKAAFAWATSHGHNVEWVPKARWVEDGNILTSSGVSAGMDMSLTAVARLLGQEKAEQAATWAEYEWHRDPDWDPFAAVYGLAE